MARVRGPRDFAQIAAAERESLGGDAAIQIVLAETIASHGEVELPGGSRGVFLLVDEQEFQFLGALPQERKPVRRVFRLGRESFTLPACIAVITATVRRVNGFRVCAALRAEEIWSPLKREWDDLLGRRFTNRELDAMIAFLRATNDLARRNVERLRSAT